VTPRAASVALALGALLAAGCTVPECATPDYSQAECRVIAENNHARLETPSGVEVRFLPAGSLAVDPWDATGLVTHRADGSVTARVAGLGPFTLAVQRDASGPDTLTVELQNVSPRATVTAGPVDAPDRINADALGQTTRRIVVPLPDTEAVFVHGTLDCPTRYTIAVAADIQTNPEQFTRIVEALQQEATRASESGEPLVGLIIPGDVTEASRDEEFDQITEILGRLPFPVAVTPGNHDIYRPTRPHYTLNFGPGNHAFTVCRTHVAMLDTGSGSLAASVQARLLELFDPGEADFSIAAMHHPPYAGWTGAGWSREDQAAHLLADAALAGVDLIVAGHSHSLVDFPAISVGDTTIREIIAGTAGAQQGLGVPRYGYVRLTFSDEIEACFVEVAPPGYADFPNDAPPMGRCAAD